MCPGQCILHKFEAGWAEKCHATTKAWPVAAPSPCKYNKMQSSMNDEQRLSKTICRPLSSITARLPWERLSSDWVSPGPSLVEGLGPVCIAGGATMDDGAHALVLGEEGGCQGLCCSEAGIAGMHPALQPGSACPWTRHTLDVLLWVPGANIDTATPSGSESDPLAADIISYDIGHPSHYNLGTPHTAHRR